MTKYYWYDDCDAYPNGWVCTCPACPCPWSLDNVNQTEGSGCFKGYTTWIGILPTLTKTISPITLPNPFKFYFNVKVVSMNTLNLFRVLLDLTANNVGIQARYVAGSNFQITIWNQGTIGTYVNVSLNEWHLIKVEVEQVGANVVVKLYVDGVYRNTFQKTWTFGNLTDIYIQDTFGSFEHYIDFLRIPDYRPIGGTYKFIFNEADLSDECIISAHYIKSHPNPDPDTFEIRVLPECGERINYFDTVEIQKLGVTEFYGFVEEITPEVGEDGLEYLITGRCWKLIAWKKWTERFQESREVGPVNSITGDIETGFFGAVKPEELVKFIMRCPISEHPKYKIRHKIGWGIASDLWDCCANITADCFYPEWVALRYTGLAWRNRGSGADDFSVENLNVDAFVLVTDNWDEEGISPWIDGSNEDEYIHIETNQNNQQMREFTFQNLVETYSTFDKIELCIKRANPSQYGCVDVYLHDGISWTKIGNINYGYGTPATKCFDVSAILNTATKINSAKVYFVTVIPCIGYSTGFHFYIYHAYLHIEGFKVGGGSYYQYPNDYFVVDMGTPHDDVTAILAECRNTPSMYARHYKIQYTNLSNCCNDNNPPREDEWNNFTPAVNVVNNQARDILHSWEPEDGVRCIRIKLTMSACNAWEISQIYIWQADKYKYRLMDEGD